MIEHTFPNLSIDVPARRTWADAIMAYPRMIVDVYHVGAGTRA